MPIICVKTGYASDYMSMYAWYLQLCSTNGGHKVSARRQLEGLQADLQVGMRRCWLIASQLAGSLLYAGGGLRKFRKRRNLVHPTTAKNKKPEDIMSEINLKQVSTEQLVEELKTREGVTVQALDLGEKSGLSVSRWMTMLLVVD